MIIDGSYVMTQGEKDAQFGRVIREEREARQNLAFIEYEIHQAAQAIREVATALQRFADEEEYPSETALETIKKAERYFDGGVLLQALLNKRIELKKELGRMKEFLTAVR